MKRFKLPALFVVCPEGLITPKGYGVSWFDPSIHSHILSPIPLNYIFAWAHFLKMEIMWPRISRRHGRFNNQIAGAMRAEYLRGRGDGILEYRAKLRGLVRRTCSVNPNFRDAYYFVGREIIEDQKSLEPYDSPPWPEDGVSKENVTGANDTP